MNTHNWHSEFNPQRFLSHVCLESLIEKNKTFNESYINNAESPCIFCTELNSRGIILNDKSFLCEPCYLKVALISYPEKYEALRRDFLIANEARNLAEKSFKQRFEHKPQESILDILGFMSLFLVFYNPILLMLSIVLFAVSYYKDNINQRKTKAWLELKSEWEKSNAKPLKPDLKHFHDPEALLSEKDNLVLKIFNHWPGYPPFWSYLRSIVLSRDSNRCQVTGCPSRLELHVHHIKSVSEGGMHVPNNLVALCDFHHALEPDKGHERIWGNIKTRYFTLVKSHARNNRANYGSHEVQTHLRRLELVTIEELHDLAKVYGFCCPSCQNLKLELNLFVKKNIIRVECYECSNFTEGPQQLTEESGPLLAEILGVTRNKGIWSARWDMLSKRKESIWGTWKGQVVAKKRKEYKQKLERNLTAPLCPKCGSSMRLKQPWQSSQKWKPFWGCSQYNVSGCNGSSKYIP
jgi:HNH endonuclease